MSSVDARTCMAHGVHCAPVVTAVTAQNTNDCYEVYPLPAELVARQLAAALRDFDTIVVKIGLVPTTEIAQAIAELLKNPPKGTDDPMDPEHDGDAGEVVAVVLDPMITAASGEMMVHPSAMDAIKEHLLPLATVATPNLMEAQLLLGGDLQNSDLERMKSAAVEMATSRGCAVLLKGGSKWRFSREEAENVLALDSKRVEVLTAPMVRTDNTMGCGCTLAAALAAKLLLSGLSKKGDFSSILVDASQAAVDYVGNAVAMAASAKLGRGVHGMVQQPLNVKGEGHSSIPSK